MNTRDLSAALKVAKKLKSPKVRPPRLSFEEKSLAGAVLEEVAKQASLQPTEPMQKQMAWDMVMVTLGVYLDHPTQRAGRGDREGGAL